MSFNWNAGYLMDSGQLSQQIPKRGFLIGVERGKEVTIVAIGNADQLRQDPSGPLGQGEELNAAVQRAHRARDKLL